MKFPYKARPNRKRHCAVCGDGTLQADIFDFYETLRGLGVEGRYAHPMCVLDTQAARKAEARKGITR